jgi:hypothetical protein
VRFDEENKAKEAVEKLAALGDDAPKLGDVKLDLELLEGIAHMRE